MQDYRIETDLLGEKQVPLEAYYGIQTLRAIENFNISNTKLSQYPHFIQSLAIVKKACAQTNHELNLLSEDIFKVIVQACDQIIEGRFNEEFPIDLYQGGAGTSTNMNINEVVANVALEIMGQSKGAYNLISPNDHVNLSQSTNDAYPTALKLSLLLMNKPLVEALSILKESLYQKSEQFKDVIKMGRTQLQDAVPMTLGQEFEAFSHLVERCIDDLNKSAQTLLEINMGATAIGTGINSPKGFDSICTQYISAITRLEFEPTRHLIAMTSDTTSFVEYSSALKKCALKLIKISNDLRLLSSGPRTGLFEIQLPAKQPGSSIMPGKVNPVVPELMNQIAYKVIGNDMTVTLASENAQLQLNVMEPVIALSLFESIEILRKGILTLTHDCIDGIVSNEAHTKKKVLESVGIVTALNPYIGYKKSTEVAKLALENNKTVREVVLDLDLLTSEELDQYLDPSKMI